MTHKQKCIAMCKEVLCAREIPFEIADFQHFYRKNKGASRNAYFIALGAADYIIKNYKMP
jgi:flavorubredoxin